MVLRSVLALVLLTSTPAFAQIDATLLAATLNCDGGVKYDDGEFTNAYASLGPFQITVMKFDLPAGTTTLDQVCNCFSRGATAPGSMNYHVVVYDDNGPGGSPGTQLALVAATASGLQSTLGTFYSTDVSAAGIVLPDTSVYIGARWPTGTGNFDSIFMCGDTSATTPLRSSFYSTSGSIWTSTSTFTVAPRAMGIRADAPTTSFCTPSATAMCLNGNRFKVEATWQTGSASGTASVNKLTDDTGYLYFFSPSNVEVVVKVLNGCGVNNRYWLFAGGLTDVRTTITVTDGKTGNVKTYTNTGGVAFAPIQDTAAFATCP